MSGFMIIIIIMIVNDYVILKVQFHARTRTESYVDYHYWAVNFPVSVQSLSQIAES